VGRPSRAPIFNRCGTVEWAWPEPDMLSSVALIPSPSLIHSLVPMSSGHPSPSPLPPTREKVTLVPSLPPGYQVAAPPPPPEHENGHFCRCRRRRCRRFAHFLATAFFLWLASRFVLLHCAPPKVDPPYHPGHFPWVRYPPLAVYLCAASLTFLLRVWAWLTMVGIITNSNTPAKSIPVSI
jgi:hypothetical protein